MLPLLVKESVGISSDQEAKRDETCEDLTVVQPLSPEVAEETKRAKIVADETTDQPRDRTISECDAGSLEMTQCRDSSQTGSDKSEEIGADSVFEATQSDAATNLSVTWPEESSNKESLLMSVATMNKSLGTLPVNLSSLAANTGKSIPAISFIEKSQMVSRAVLA